MGTKKEAIERKAAWSKALQEGRVVRYNGGMTLTSYPTVERARQALQEFTLAGMRAELVGKDGAIENNFSAVEKADAILSGLD